MHPHTVRCPRCGAVPGEPCLNAYMMVEDVPHASRTALASSSTRWEYTLVRRGNGKISGKPQPTPLLFESVLRDEKKARRFEIHRRPLIPGDWEPYTQ